MNPDEHYAYIIARLSQCKRPQYCCIAAIRHPHCSGLLPLRAAQRFITLARQPENAEIIRWELSDITFGQRMYRTPSPRALLPTPCPYLSFLLTMCWYADLSEDPEQTYISGGRDQYQDPARDVDKDLTGDHITVFDMTDPEHPAYCFLPLATSDPSGLRPLNAAQYLTAFHPDILSFDSRPQDGTAPTGESVRSFVHNFPSKRLVTPEMLREAWPSRFRQGKRSRRASSEDTRSSRPEPAIPTLAELCWEPAVTQAVEDGCVQSMQEMVSLPGGTARIRGIITKNQPSPPDSYEPELLLCKAMAMSGDTLDLSDSCLPAKQILEVLSSCAHLEVLNISKCVLEYEDMEQCLPLVPSLKRLVLLPCPAPAAALHHMMLHRPGLFKALDTIIHASFTGRASKELRLRPNAFTFLRAHTNRSPARAPGAVAYEYRGCSLAVSTPQRIVQCLTDYFAAMMQDPRRLETAADSAYACYAAFTGTRREGQSWGERSVVTLPHLHGAAFKGEGWLFALLNQVDGPDGATKYKWGFVRWRQLDTMSGVKAKAPQVDSWSQLAKKREKTKKALIGHRRVPAATPSPERPPRRVPDVHDLSSFLNILYEDGRPRASEDAVRKLESLLQALQEKVGATMITADDLRPYESLLETVH